MINYAAVLLAIRPGAEWSVGDTYESLVWLDDSPKPTRKTLDDAWPAVEHELAVAAVQTARQARYQAESDPMFFEAQRGESGVTIADWEAKVAAIKADLPMPTED